MRCWFIRGDKGTEIVPVLSAVYSRGLRLMAESELSDCCGFYSILID